MCISFSAVEGIIEKEYLMSQFCHCSQYLSRWMVVGIVSLILGCMLAACGSSTTTGSQKPPTSQEVNCGSVSNGLSETSSSAKSNTQKAVTCFSHAYQQCQPATLTFTTFAVDTGAIHHFSVQENGSSCSIHDSEQNYRAPKPPGTANMYPCSTMLMQRNGLSIQQCGKLGTITIPLS